MATRDSGRMEWQRARQDGDHPHNPLEAFRPEGWRYARPPVPCMDWPAHHRCPHRRTRAARG